MASFFFQAEDGIRDLTVTGVQTCALPIYFFFKFLKYSMAYSTRFFKFTFTPFISRSKPLICSRSEERRVGKEFTTGLEPDVYEKTQCASTPPEWHSTEH